MEAKNPRGRKPKPPTLPIAPPVSRPDPPEYVATDPVALSKFLETVDHLDNLGLLSRTDTDTIALYATTFADYLDNLSKIASEGKVVTTKAGFLANSPYVNQKNQNHRQLEKLARELLLTPSSRGATINPKSVEVDPLVAFLNRGAG